MMLIMVLICIDIVVSIFSYSLSHKQHKRSMQMLLKAEQELIQAYADRNAAIERWKELKEENAKLDRCLREALEVAMGKNK